MRGYKGTDKDMKCRGYQYELGKTYTHNGNVEICVSGFHFCNNIFDVFKYYSRDHDNRYFEIEATGIVKLNSDKCVSSEITFIREITIEEVNKAYYGDGDGDGYGDGYGNGYGYGDGNGYGNGNGDGYGYGNGYGNGNGNGDGDGYGYGNGYGNGNGDGDGYGDIQKILIFK